MDMYTVHACLNNTPSLCIYMYNSTCIFETLYLLCVTLCVCSFLVCFELLDVDKDGRLNESEMKRALVMMTTVLKDNSPQTQDCNGLPHETTPTDTTPTEVAADSPGTRTQPCCDIDTLMEKFENNFKVKKTNVHSIHVFMFYY